MKRLLPACATVVALTTSVLLVLAGVCGASAGPFGTVAAAAATGPGGSYVPVVARRVLDTRVAVGVPTRTPVGARQSVTFAVTGSGLPVPAGASAVVLNVTATAPTAGGFVTAYATGAARPTASTLNFAAGRTVPNLVLARVSADGHVTLFNGSPSGSVQLIADLSAYYTGGVPVAGQQGAFGSVAPGRLLDTRSRIGVTTTTPVAAHSSVTFTAEGVLGVPDGVAAVALNITATGSTAAGYLVAFASGSTQPATSNVNYARGQTVATLSVTRTGGDHRVTIYNGSPGSVHVVVDVQGYFTAGDPVTAGDLAALAPVRVLNPTTVPPGQSIELAVGGRGGVPITAVSAVMVGVTVVNAQRGGYLTVYQGRDPKPDSLVSNLNFVAGQIVANLVAAQNSSGTLRLYNGSSGTLQVIVDVSAYVIADSLPLPATSAAHYVRSVSAAAGHFADPSSAGVGCADARAGDTFVLLDIGAQLNDRTGVELTVTDTRVSYAALVSAINGYLSSYRTCGTGAVTIAVGTNNEGDFTAYPAANRGADWANDVVDAITAVSGVTVDGANDIEGSFASTEAQAQQWETAYLAATPAQLIYNGSADGCPDGYGAGAATCEFGWTQAQYYSLAHNGTRIQALPQVYAAAYARQWANIDRLGGSGIIFRGSLTEHAAGCTDGTCDTVPPQGWAYLYHAISTVVTTPSLPVAADLGVLS